MRTIFAKRFSVKQGGSGKHAGATVKKTLTQLSVFFYSSSVKAVECEGKTAQEAVSHDWLNPLVVSPALIVTE